MIGAAMTDALTLRRLAVLTGWRPWRGFVETDAPRGLSAPVDPRKDGWGADLEVVDGLVRIHVEIVGPPDRLAAGLAGATTEVERLAALGVRHGEVAP